MPEQARRQYRYFDLIMTVFVTVLVVSNIASSAKIVDGGVSLLGVPMAFDAGTILFPVGYTSGDILTEVYGYKQSRRAIWAGFFCLALTAIIFWIVGRLPGEATWQGYAGDVAYQAIHWSWSCWRCRRVWGQTLNVHPDNGRAGCTFTV